MFHSDDRTTTRDTILDHDAKESEVPGILQRASIVLFLLRRKHTNRAGVLPAQPPTGPMSRVMPVGRHTRLIRPHNHDSTAYIRDSMKLSAIISPTLLAASLAFSALLQSEPSGLPYILPAAMETEMARAAAPPRISDEAGIYLLGENGYVLSEASKNGYHCLVQRDAHPDAMSMAPEKQLFAPQCYDSAGTDSHVARFVEVSRLIRAEGMSTRDAFAKVDADTDAYRPRTMGIAYMASALNTVTNPEDLQGPNVGFYPHVMFYAPDIADDQISKGIGTAPGGFASGWPFMAGRPRTNGLLIVPLDRGIQRDIRRDQKKLVKQLEKYIPVKFMKMK